MLEEIREIILEQLDLEEDEIREESRIIEDLGADSLDVIEIISLIEEKYGIEIDKKEIEKVKTVSDMINIINNKRD